MDITIRDYSDDHALCTVINRGKQYSTVWAKEFDDNGKMVSPTIEDVRQAFKDNPRSFDKYNVSRGY